MKTKQIIATISEMVKQQQLCWVSKHYDVCNNPEKTKVDTFKLVPSNYKLDPKEGWLIPHLERCGRQDLLKVIEHINHGHISREILVQEVDTQGQYAGVIDMYAHQY